MTEGSIYRHLLSYAVPLIFGNMLQLTYNAVDAVIVSKGAGVAALSAVSVSNPVSTLIVQGISGIGIGASVYMSKFYGAGDLKALKRSLSSTLIFGSVLSIVIMLIGMLLSPWILLAMQVPQDILAPSLLYLRMIFIGNIFTFLYNIMSSALRAVGDSKTPVYFVGAASVLNGLLDAVLIFGFHMGVLGAAIATIVAEAVSAVLCFIYVYRHIPALQISRKEMTLDSALLKKILSSGMITALQQSAQPIGKLLIQSVVNIQGVDVIAAFNVAAKIDDYGRIPTQTISHGMMTCTAQNRGAKKLDRTRETLRKGILIGCVYYPCIVFCVLVLREPLIRIFAPETGGESMVAIAISYLSLKITTVIFPVLTNGIQGYFRGMNNMWVTLYSTLIQISFRTIFCFILIPVMGINGEVFACVIGWVFMILFEYGYYFFVFRPKTYKA